MESLTCQACSFFSWSNPFLSETEWSMSHDCSTITFSERLWSFIQLMIISLTECFKVNSVCMCCGVEAFFFFHWNYILWEMLLFRYIAGGSLAEGEEAQVLTGSNDKWLVKRLNQLRPLLLCVPVLVGGLPLFHRDFPVLKVLVWVCLCNFATWLLERIVIVKTLDQKYEED